MDFERICDLLESARSIEITLASSYHRTRARAAYLGVELWSLVLERDSMIVRDGRDSCDVATLAGIKVNRCQQIRRERGWEKERGERIDSEKWRIIRERIRETRAEIKAVRASMRSRADALKTHTGHIVNLIDERNAMIVESSLPVATIAAYARMTHQNTKIIKLSKKRGK